MKAPAMRSSAPESTTHVPYGRRAAHGAPSPPDAARASIAPTIARVGDDALTIPPVKAPMEYEQLTTDGRLRAGDATESDGGADCTMCMTPSISRASHGTRC